MINVIDLPEVIFYLFQSYISEKEYRNLLNSCSNNQNLKELKKKSCFYSLNSHSARQFIADHDQNFRNHLLSLIEDPTKQIGINLKCFGPIYDRDYGEIVHNGFPLETFRSFHSITLFHSDWECDWDEVIKLKNLQVFSSIQILKISNCLEMKQLSGLFMIHDLLIENFPNLTDISPLFNCPYLEKVHFSNCPKLSEINALSKVSVISIDHCPVTDNGIKQLYQVKNLYLYGVPTITNVNHLLSLNQLHLIQCYRIISINGLIHLKKLLIHSCKNFVSFSSLLSLKDIEICDCNDFVFKQNDNNNMNSSSSSSASSSTSSSTSSTLSLQMKKLKYSVVDHSDFEQEEVDDVLNTVGSHSFTLDYSWKLINDIKNSFPSLEILSLEFFTKNIKLSINDLVQLLSLRKLSIVGISDQDFDIHLFQQIVWFSIISLVNFQGITKSMPNLRTFSCRQCSHLQTINGLKGNKKLKLNLTIIPTLFITDIDFHTICCNASLLNIDYITKREKPMHFQNRIGTFAHVVEGSELSLINQQQETERDILVGFGGRLLFLDNTMLLSSFFTHIKILCLTNLPILNLSLLTAAGVHQIPILSLSLFRELQTLYPEGVIPTHQHLLIEHCSSLVDVGSPSSLQSISLVSISCCSKLIDFRGLHGCKQIQYSKEKPRYVQKYRFVQDNRIGFNEIADIIEPFIPLKEKEEFVSCFTFEKSHRIHYDCE